MTLDPDECAKLPEFMTPADCRRFLGIRSSATHLPDSIPFFSVTCLKSASNRRYVYRAKFLEWFKALAGIDVTQEQNEACYFRILSIIDKMEADFKREGEQEIAALCKSLKTKVMEDRKNDTNAKLPARAC